MIIEFPMPRLSETADTGKIVEWHVPVGGQVRKGAPLLGVETDKAIVEIESPADGFLRQVFFDRGAEVRAQAVLALLADTLTEALPAIDPYHRLQGAQPAWAEGQPAPQVAGDEPKRERLLASPVALQLAQERGVDLRQVQGTGPGGRITRDDVLRASSSPEPGATGRVRAIPLSRMRSSIAASMLRSKQTVPHAYVQIEVDMAAVVAFRAALLQGYQGAEHVGCSYTDLLVKAAALALNEFPLLNSRWQEDQIELCEEINIGIAVSLDDEGLIVPVITNADRKPLTQIARETKELIQKAKGRRLAAAEFSGGTFTISNLGMYGVDNFVAIIRPPESAILAVGAIIKKPVVIGDGIQVRPMMQMTLSIDHRVVDGALAARFLQRVRAILSEPEVMLRPGSSGGATGLMGGAGAGTCRE